MELVALYKRVIGLDVHIIEWLTGLAAGRGPYFSMISQQFLTTYHQ
jgi:hypothetical protein